MPRRYATQVFGAAAVMNVGVGVGLFVAPAATLAMMGMQPPSSQVLLQLAAWLILVFGVGYAFTARDPDGNRDLMRLGAIGKMLVLPLMLAAWRRGEVGPAGVASGGGDLVFALLFLDVLRRTRREMPSAA